MTAAVKKAMEKYIERKVGMPIEEIRHRGIEETHDHLERNKLGRPFTIQNEPGGMARGSVLIQRGRVQTRDEINKRFKKKFG